MKMCNFGTNWKLTSPNCCPCCCCFGFFFGGRGVPLGYNAHYDINSYRLTYIRVAALLCSYAAKSDIVIYLSLINFQFCEHCKLAQEICHQSFSVPSSRMGTYVVNSKYPQGIS